MKRPWLLLLLSLAACSTKLGRFDQEIEVLAVDLREYSAAGFLFTPDPLYAGKYDALGIVSVTMSASGQEVKVVRGVHPERVWNWAPLNIQDALREMQKRVVEMGGNALVNFKLEARPTVDARPSYQVSGFAIKRLDVIR